MVQLNANISTSRYDQFSITLPTDLNLKSGQYMYFVYQSLTPIDVDFENMVLLERGKALIYE